MQLGLILKLFGCSKAVWLFLMTISGPLDFKTIDNEILDYEEAPAGQELSETMSEALKKARLQICQSRLFCIHS